MIINKWKFCDNCDGKGKIKVIDKFGIPIIHKCKKCKGRGTVEDITVSK